MGGEEVCLICPDNRHRIGTHLVKPAPQVRSLSQEEAMPIYAVRLNHPPDQCPTANAETREMMQKGAAELPRLAEQLGVKFIAGPYVLGAEHDGLAIVEAQNVEKVEDFIMRSGMV